MKKTNEENKVFFSTTIVGIEKPAISNIAKEKTLNPPVIRVSTKNNHQT